MKYCSVIILHTFIEIYATHHDTAEIIHKNINKYKKYLFGNIFVCDISSKSRNVETGVSNWVQHLLVCIKLVTQHTEQASTNLEHMDKFLYTAIDL